MPKHNFRTIVSALLCVVATAASAQGQVWEQAGYGGGGQFYVVAIDPTDSNIFYLGSDVAGLYKSWDAGDSWDSVSSGLVSLQVASFAIDPSDTDRLWLGTPLGLHLSTDGGDAWTLVEPTIRCFKHVNFGGIAVSPDGQTVLVAGHAVNGDMAGDGTLYRSSNGGVNFSTVSSFPGTKIPAVAFDPHLGSRAFLLVRDGGMRRSTDSGANWHDFSTGLPAGRTWQQLDVGQAVVYATAEPAVGADSAGVFRSVKTTAAWISVDASLTSGEESGGLEVGDPIRIDPTNDNQVYVGQDGWPYNFFRTSNGGSTWTGTPVDTAYTFDTVHAPHGVYFDPYQGPFDIAVAPLNPSTVLYSTWVSAWLSTNGGASFSEKIVGAQNMCTTAVHVVGDTLLATVMDGGVGLSADDGWTWTSAYPTSIPPVDFWLHAWSIEEASGGDLYFGAGTTDGPTVYRSTDGGGSWQATGAGLPSSVNPGIDVFTEISLAADPVSPTTMYAGVDLFGLYKTTNSGASWELVVDRSGINGSDEPVTKCIEVDPNNNQRIFMGDHWNGLWYSENGGQTWFQTNAPGLEGDSVQDIVALPDGRIWAAYADGVYLSTDNGHSFSRSFPVLANLGESELEYVESIAVNPADSTDLAVSTAKRYPVWYNRGSVWRSTNNGANWTDITGDIPSHRVKDLVYSASNLYAATWCAHVYSTPLDGSVIFADGFEDSTTSAWSNTVP